MKRRHLLQGAAASALAAEAAFAAAASPPSVAAPASRKTLRIAFPAPESSFDPTQTNSDLYSSTIIAQILEAPLAYDYLARPVRLVPQTAAALPEVSADGRTITVRLQPGIFFADDPAFKGRKRELVAQDYVYAIKRFYDPQYNSSDLYLFETAKLLGLSAVRERAVKSRQPFDYDAEVEGLKALDRYTFRLVLGEANPRFVYLLADSAIAGAVAREVVEFYGKDIGAHPVGTGAFRLKSWRRASRIVLERNPGYRRVVYEGTPADAGPEGALAQPIARSLAGRALPLVDEVQVDIVEESQPRWLSFLNGSYHWLAVPGDFVRIAAPGGELAPFLKKKGVTLLRSLQPGITMSFFFMEHPLVGGYTAEKVALRRAIGLAFDGESYIRQVHGGQMVPAQSTIPPFTSGFDTAYRSEMSTFDPARAQALLDLHGYVDRNGDGWREQPDGRPLVLQMSSGSSQRERLSNELWKRAMDRIGLKMEFDISTWPELLKKSRAGTMMMWGYSWSAGSPDGGFFLGIAYGPNASESNDPRFQLDAFDRLYERQLRLPDGPEREALMRQAKDLLVAYLPFKVHGHGIANDLVQPWTKHYWRHPFMRDIWRFVDVGG
ncbi:MAG: ABC transporter substrate-binding protein [Betaproteobacteria bacterium]|jgi:ABC-type transport system substrate-binding protein